MNESIKTVSQRLSQEIQEQYEALGISEPVRRLGEELIDLQRRSIETLKQYL